MKKLWRSLAPVSAYRRFPVIPRTMLHQEFRSNTPPVQRPQNFSPRSERVLIWFSFGRPPTRGKLMHNPRLLLLSPIYADPPSRDLPLPQSPGLNVDSIPAEAARAHWTAPHPRLIVVLLHQASLTYHSPRMGSWTRKTQRSIQRQSLTALIEYEAERQFRIEPHLST